MSINFKELHEYISQYGNVNDICDKLSEIDNKKINYVKKDAMSKAVNAKNIYNFDTFCKNYKTYYKSDYVFIYVKDTNCVYQYALSDVFSNMVPDLCNIMTEDEMKKGNTVYELVLNNSKQKIVILSHRRFIQNTDLSVYVNDIDQIKLLKKYIMEFINTNDHNNIVVSDFDIISSVFKKTIVMCINNVHTSNKDELDIFIKKFLIYLKNSDYDEDDAIFDLLQIHGLNISSNFEGIDLLPISLPINIIECDKKNIREDNMYPIIGVPYNNIKWENINIVNNIQQNVQQNVQQNINGDIGTLNINSGVINNTNNTNNTNTTITYDPNVELFRIGIKQAPYNYSSGNYIFGTDLFAIYKKITESNVTNNVIIRKLNGHNIIKRISRDTIYHNGRAKRVVKYKLL